MLVGVAVGLAVIVILFVVYVATLPSAFRVERSISIACTPPQAFAHVNDLRKWEAWSPWAKLDPAMKSTYDGPAAGPGAVYSWQGNSKVGSGRMTITEATEGDRICIKLEFLKPFKAANTAVFAFNYGANRTAVTWTMTGKLNFVSKAMGLFMNMDKMVGRDFEKGLSQLKAVVEAR